MKKINYIISAIFIKLFLIKATFAEKNTDSWILWDFRNGNSEETAEAIRRWDIHLDDIPEIIKNAIDFGLGFAGTIAVIFIIIWAYQVLFGSLEQDTTKWKNTIIMAIWWFVIASLAWFIIKLIIDNLA